MFCRHTRDLVTGLLAFAFFSLMSGGAFAADITGYLEQQERLEARQKALSDVQEILSRAQTGEAQGQYEMGLAFRHGWGVERDDLKAAIWLREAADKEHARAQHELGLMYEFGQGLPRSYSRALEFYEMAAAQNLKEAHRSLLLLMAKTQNSNGTDIKKDDKLYEH